MAIAYQNTSVSAASAVLAGTAAQTAIRDALVAHASGAWTLVEEFDSAGATVHWVVVKCATAQSAVGFDFFVAIGRLTATGQLCLMVGETYVPTTTHTLGTVVPFSSSFSNGNTINSDGSWTAGAAGGAATTVVLGATFPTQSSGNVFAPVDTAAATMRFITTVEKEYAIVHLNSTSWYIGALTDLIVPSAGLVAATPVGLFDLWQTQAQNFGGLTRHPIAAADAPFTVGYSHCCVPFLHTQGAWMTPIQQQAIGTAIYGYGDRLQGPRVSAAELAALFYGGVQNLSTGNTTAKLGVVRAKFKGLRFTTFPFGAVAYDTVLVDAKKHAVLKDQGAVGGGGQFVNPVNYATTTKFGYVVDSGAP